MVYWPISIHYETVHHKFKTYSKKERKKKVLSHLKRMTMIGFSGFFFYFLFFFYLTQFFFEEDLTVDATLVVECKSLRLFYIIIIELFGDGWIRVKSFKHERI